MTMFNPPHPGEILKELYISPLGLKQKDLAEGLGVTKKALSELLNAHAGVSTVMAIRLSEAFDTSPEVWLNLQQQYDLYKVRAKLDVSHICHYREEKNNLMA